MKTENERVCEIMEMLLAHQPIIDVPYEKINDIAVALVQEGYGNISEYKVQIANLKADFDSLQESYEFVRDCDAEHCLEINETVKQAQIDVLNKLKEKCKFDGHTVAVYKNDIEEMIKELKK